MAERRRFDLRCGIFATIREAAEPGNGWKFKFGLASGSHASRVIPGPMRRLTKAAFDRMEADRCLPGFPTSHDSRIRQNDEDGLEWRARKNPAGKPAGFDFVVAFRRRA
jgi:hypothetical protein